jgi:hypothetical protein
MNIDDNDVAFAVRQVWRQLSSIRGSCDRDEINVLGPRCSGYISALASVGAISQLSAIQLRELAYNAWTHALNDTRRSQWPNSTSTPT